ncbi:MAG TPA: DUF2124 family protein [Methanomicrobiales archaeon]|nr:DUF2124 family protein [Methanomicrobiales archaeon]
MKEHRVFESVPGILRPFKAYIDGLSLAAGDQVVYYGCPGTCTPFIELLGFALRASPALQVFVPLTDESKARRIVGVADVGMQVSQEKVKVNPKLVVLMGGLSMPGTGVTAEQMKAVVSKYPVPVVGVCFMKMFEKTGWTKVFDFSLLIDANIAPVDVWQ